MSERKQGYLEEAVEGLAKIRDTRAAVLPYTNEALTAQLNRLSADMLHGLCDALGILRREDEELFEAFLEWVHEDAGGDTLMRLVPTRIGYQEWLLARTKETIGRCMQ